jgi:very-short-patch-repair endonuclease
LLVNEAIIIQWHNKTRKHFEKLGYSFTSYGEDFEIKIVDLPIGSNKKIDTYCDYCLEENTYTIVTKPYERYLKSRDVVQKDACKNCTSKKGKESNLIVYGVENTFQLEGVKKKAKQTQISKYGALYSQTEKRKEQIKNTNLEKYGVENPMQNETIKQKTKNTVKEKYGVDNVFQVEEFKEKHKETIKERYGCEYVSQMTDHQDKCKETSLSKYGTEHPFQSEEIKNKSVATNIRKYGVEHYTQTEEYIEKAIHSNLEKYGTEWASQSELVRDKITKTVLERYGVDNFSKTDEFNQKYKATMNERYGVDHYSQTDDYKEKVVSTNLEKYGVEWAIQNEDVKQKIFATNIERYGFKVANMNPEVRKKAVNTLYKNGTCQVSSQQLAIYELLKDSEYKVELNYPLSNVNLDVAIFIGNIKIDLEYDCWYWHKDNQKYDRKRDEFTKSQGWKVLRVKSNKKIPSLEELIQSIDKLINSSRKYTEIVLDDWGNKEVS